MPTNSPPWSKYLGTARPIYSAGLAILGSSRPAPAITGRLSASEAAWRAALKPYYDELGLDAASIPAGPGRRPFDADSAALLAEFKPRVVSFHFGLPAPDLLAQVKSWGSKVLASATTVREALWLEEHGADAVIAQGLEAGGHRGNFLSMDISEQMGTFALLPQIAATVRVPVIAAGGIVDGRGIRAALVLGASAVQMGTAFLCCHEATTSALHRAALLSPAGRHTALTNLFSGRPARGIVNRLMRELGPLGGEGRRQRAGHVGEAAGLEEREDLGTNLEYVHGGHPWRASSICWVTSTTPPSVRWKRRASSSGSSPITRPSGSSQPRSMTTLRSRQWRLICTSGSTTASLISQ